MNFKSFLLFLLVFSFCACNSKKEVSEGTANSSTPAENKQDNLQQVKVFSADELNDTTTIVRLIKGACFGSCPVFIFELKANGDAFFNGIRFVDDQGKHSKTLKQEEYIEVFERAASINFYHLEKEYDAQVTDLPSSTIYLNNGVENHQTRLRFNIPEEVGKFNKWLTDWVLSIQWKKDTNSAPEEDQ